MHEMIERTLCCDCYNKINIFFYSVQLWAQKIGKPCSIEDARTLHEKYICKHHFLETDFTTPERKRLNRGAVPCSSDSATVVTSFVGVTTRAREITGTSAIIIIGSFGQNMWLVCEKITWESHTFSSGVHYRIEVPISRTPTRVSLQSWRPTTVARLSSWAKRTSSFWALHWSICEDGQRLDGFCVICIITMFRGMSRLT